MNTGSDSSPPPSPSSRYTASGRSSAPPIAIVVNAFRVALTGYLAHNFGDAAAEGMIHQTEGFFTFGLAFALLLFEAWCLQTLRPAPKRKRVVRTRRAAS